MNFVARGIKGVKIEGSALNFLPTLQGPCTVSTSQPFTPPGKHAFEVLMPVKDCRTAVGFSSDPPIATYLTPSYTSGRGSPYVSMGGAGFIYPATMVSGSSYGRGDSVRCEVDFEASSVSFYVNGVAAGPAVAWEGGEKAYPSVSSEGGVVECIVSFE